MAYATVEDVQARYHEDLDEAMELVVETRLADAELLLRNRIPDLDARIADPVEWPNYLELVIMIECEMVLRLIRNPEGYSQESDGNYSYAIYQMVASGRLEVLDSEWDLLNPPGSGAMFVITPKVGYSGLPEGSIDPSKCWPPPWWEDW